MFNTTLRNTVVGALLACGLVAAQAAAITYNNQAAFLAANPGLGLVSFEGQTANIGSSMGGATSLGGISFTGISLTYVDSSFWGSHDSLLDNVFNGFIQANFAASDAIGFYFGSSYGDGVTVQFTAFNGLDVVHSEAITGGGTQSNFAYYGLTGVGAITSFRVDSANTGGFISLAEISIGEAANAVPAPASLALAVAALGLMGGLGRRSAKTSQ
jgi:hypothetical protein